LKADVVVAAGDNARACLDAVYRRGGAALGRVTAVCDAPADAALLGELQDQHPQLIVLRTEAKRGRVAAWNLGLFLRSRDVLLLDDDVLLGEGCLEAMLEVLHGSDRIASVAPLVSDPAPSMHLAGIPRLTDVPTARGSCLLLRHALLNMIGGFDPAFERADEAQDDWAMRAQRMGMRHVRANRAVAVVGHPVTAQAEHAHGLLLERHPHLPEQASAALLGAEPHAAAHFVASRRAPPEVCTALPPNGDPLRRFQVLYHSGPIDGRDQLLVMLESPYHLVLGQTGTYRNRALLIAAAHSAQALIAASDQERAALIAELGLQPARVHVVESEAGLTSVFRNVVEHPCEDSLRYRALLANFLRSLGEGADDRLGDTSQGLFGGR